MNFSGVVSHVRPLHKAVPVDAAPTTGGRSNPRRARVTPVPQAA